MKICKYNHEEIVYLSKSCPLCWLRKHNRQVHDFIESKGMDLVRELVKYLEDNKN